VFVERHDERSEQIVTAESGRLVQSADGESLQLELSNGLIVDARSDGTRTTMQFSAGRINEDFTAAPPPFRARGTDDRQREDGKACRTCVRELTLPELRATALPDEPGGVTAAQRAGELHGRLARSVMPLLLPLLALPLGMAAKRGRRAPGTVFAVLALLTLDQMLSFGEGLAEAGRATPWVSVWLPVVLFAALGVWLFRSSLQWPGDNPVMRAVSAIEGAFDGLKRRKDHK
jgi:lipopolysaccharide export system permease protein